MSAENIEGESFNGVKNKDSVASEYILYGYRHFELTLYCFAAMANQMTWISL